VTAVDVEVDLTTLDSDSDRREGALRTRGLESARFPTATFNLTEPMSLPAGLTDGERATLSATGDLTIHGVSNEVTGVLLRRGRRHGLRSLRRSGQPGPGGLGVRQGDGQLSVRMAAVISTNPVRSPVPPTSTRGDAVTAGDRENEAAAVAQSGGVADAAANAAHAERLQATIAGSQVETTDSSRGPEDSAVSWPKNSS
jgi:hypothetical protein